MVKRDIKKENKRINELKKWKVNDLILMSYSLRRTHLGEGGDSSDPVKFVRLVAWNMEEVIVDLPDPKGHFMGVSRTTVKAEDISSAFLFTVSTG